jgi:hypothetical protein
MALLQTWKNWWLGLEDPVTCWLTDGKKSTCDLVYFNDKLKNHTSRFMQSGRRVTNNKRIS